jgi:hypothetical protein
VTLNCEKIVKLLHQRQQYRAGVLGAPGSHGAPGVTGLLQEGGGRQPGSQCDVLVCVRGRDGRLQVRSCPSTIAIVEQLFGDKTQAIVSQMCIVVLYFAHSQSHTVECCSPLFEHRRQA